ncbi:A/G-specific adenine glycosylase MutY [Psychroflexus torquis ATCC 700755]|uniref:Adenine DNA glycosylase n=1 Tax=Psychroflexus torquis (strain ATCC 700755 / CIP 106069 / ACAM 623) TaxID=313595 RepID=K4ICX4_PSYTT|nr:A/G-specific adenine glycosylase [Psychroflexus torquis]AFU68264.1 A/G-specific adenine glycosylase MutY [Psychroflexus torquis ATCC 700755]
MDFSKRLLDWYETEKRDLPWRHTKDPYVIWLSEIILQQTQVKQGLPYFEKFIERFPTVHNLAKAKEDEVMKLWQGLGYYSRARNLHFTAKYVSETLKGKFPDNFKDLKTLKGVGDYTAAAIASFAFDESVAVVDGNVQRVVSRFLGIHTPINSSEGIKEFKTKAQQLMDTSNPATYNQAIMEFGALHCRPKSPKCMFCVFQQDCAAYQLGKVEELPVKLKKTIVKKRYFNYLIFKDQDNVTLVQKRRGAGIWRGLYQFPLLESEEPSETPSSEDIKSLLDTGDFHIDRIEKLNETPVVHLLSHRKIMATFIQVSCVDSLSKLKLSKGIETYNLKELQKLPVPVLIQNFIESEFSLA